MTSFTEASRCLVFVAVFAACSAVPALAGATPEQMCEAGKNVVAGKYVGCLSKAQQRFVVGQMDAAGRDAAVLECGERYSAKWQRLEEKAGPTVCPSEGDEASIQDFLNACILSAEESLNGSPLLPDVVTCNGDLTTCAASLGTCTTSLTTCNVELALLANCSADLGTCATNLSATNADLGACSTNLSATNADLVTCEGDLSTCGGSLATCDGELTTCDGALAGCGADLGACGTNLSATNADLVTCEGDLSTCGGSLATCQAQPTGQVHETGQVLCHNGYGAYIVCVETGQDGELRKGVPNSFTDNGDTITDNQTGLMWEKLDDNNVGGVHDWNDTYTWTNAFQTKIATLNSTSFAGYDDWRLPNRKELDSLVHLGVVDPAVFEEFHAACVPGCTVATCSCTRSDLYWTSTGYHVGPADAWYINFFDGNTGAFMKTDTFHVRAVRGGS